MAAISASDVKKLRDLTGAGMMDCKKALTQADGDFAQAEKILKEMGLAAVAKRQDRATENGRVFVMTDDKNAVLLSLSCETDFVASNEEFKALGENMCKTILEKGYSEPNEELKGMVDALIATIKENMNITKMHTESVDTYAATYIHGNGAVAVLINMHADNKDVFNNADVQEVAHDLALHAAAYKPQYLDEKNVDKAYEEEQLSIFTAQVDQDPKMANKPEQVKANIIKGKLSKLYKEICFNEQAFVKDDSKSVKQVLSELSKKYGCDITISSYIVYQAGVNA